MDFNNYINHLLLESKKDFYGWLSPDGKFISLQGTGMDHQTYAQYRLLDDKDNHRDILDRMFAKGWQRITHYSDHVYTHNAVRRPNNLQLRHLRDDAIEHHMRDIHWDNDTDDIVLWKNETNTDEWHRDDQI